MNTSLPLLTVALLIAAAPPEKAAPAKEKGEAKVVELAKNVQLEVLPSGQRRVLVNGEVCFREGALELLVCRKHSKEHESLVTADVDAREIHKALIVAGGKPGSPVKYEPKYEPAKGSPVKVLFRYKKDGKEVTVDAREWVRDAKTGKDLSLDWVFGGSFFYNDPTDPKKPQWYAANGGDLVCVSNFPSAMLDLPIASPEADAARLFEAHTSRVPPLGTKVTIILEPQPDKKDGKK